MARAKDPKDSDAVAQLAAQQAIARILLLLEDELDREWTLDSLAERAGYAKHHFARTFAELTGTTPIEYLRALRLHRAAHRLATDPDFDVFAASRQAHYGSMKAFRRAFERELGRSPGEFRREHIATRSIERDSAYAMPEGLATQPEIELFGPLAGIAIRSPGLSVAEMTATLMSLYTLAAPEGAYKVGSSSPPRGWTGAGAGRRDFRCIYVTDAYARKPPSPPLEPWAMGVHRFARFDYAGPMSGLGAVYTAIFDGWLPRSSFRYAFAPVVTLFDDGVWKATGFQRAAARIYIPIERV